MWLSGMKRPDFRTIIYYRGKRLKDGFDSLVTQVVEQLHEEGFVSLKVQYIDGTKIESVANKYTFVWRGAVEKYDAKLKAKTEALLKKIEQNHSIETQENPAADELSVEEVVNRVERIKNKILLDTNIYKYSINSLRNRNNLISLVFHILFVVLYSFESKRPYTLPLASIHDQRMTGFF